MPDQQPLGGGQLRATQRVLPLTELLDELDREDGPLDAPEDQAAIQRYVDLLT